MRQKYERELASLKQLMEERVSGVTSTLEGKLAAAEKQHIEERDRDRKTAAEALVQTKQVRLGLVWLFLLVSGSSDGCQGSMAGVTARQIFI